MKLYKPFELLYCSVETFYNWTGVGACRLFSDPPVIGLIATIQWFNLITLAHLFTKYTNIKIGFIYYGLIYLTLIILNIVHFNNKTAEKLLSEFDFFSQIKRNVIGISSLLYIIGSCILMIVTY